MAFYREGSGEVAAEIVDRIEVEHVVDTTGAGDSFAAGLAYGYLEYRRLRRGLPVRQRDGRSALHRLRNWTSTCPERRRDGRSARPMVLVVGGQPVMNSDFAGKDSRWQIVEDGFDPSLANTYETLFTTGNGYLGTRGSWRRARGCTAGTFLRGVFDHHDSAVIDLVKAPDWLELAIVVNGVKIDVTPLDRPPSTGPGHAGGHPVARDRLRGLSGPTDPHRDDPVRQQRRPASVLPAGPVTPENHTAPIIVHSGIDATGYNLDRRPFYAEPPPADPQMKWHKWAKSRHLDEVSRAEIP